MVGVSKLDLFCVMGLAFFSGFCMGWAESLKLRGIGSRSWAEKKSRSARHPQLLILRETRTSHSSTLKGLTPPSLFPPSPQAPREGVTSSRGFKTFFLFYPFFLPCFSGTGQAGKSTVTRLPSSHSHSHHHSLSHPRPIIPRRTDSEKRKERK